MSLKINKSNILLYICWFLILLYPFNCTISKHIYYNNIIELVSIILPIFLLFIYGNNIKKINKYQGMIFFITLLFMLIFLINNYYIVEKRYLTVVRYIIYLILPFVISYNNKKTIETFEKVLVLFLLEHIIATFFVQIFHDFYVTKMIPWIAMDDAVAKISLNAWVMRGYNAGLTSHYSTNGIYLSIAVIYFFSKYTNTTKKKHLFLTFISLVALLLTAKRAHLLFSIISCIAIYFYNNKDKIHKRLFKFFTSFFIIIIGLLFLSFFVPEILNVVDRFSNVDALNGRGQLYDVFKYHWTEHMLIGHGWGYFSYYYEMYLQNSTYNIYHYIDGHNVYFQLLLEVGLLGFAFIGTIIAYILLSAKKILKNKNEPINIFCFGYIVFFLLYCLTGNPLYDVQCYSVLFIVTGIVLANKNNRQNSNKLKKTA